MSQKAEQKCSTDRALRVRESLRLQLGVLARTIHLAGSMPAPQASTWWRQSLIDNHSGIYVWCNLPSNHLQLSRSAGATCMLQLREYKSRSSTFAEPATRQHPLHSPLSMPKAQLTFTTTSPRFHPYSQQLRRAWKREMRLRESLSNYPLWLLEMLHLLSRCYIYVGIFVVDPDDWPDM
ncbi:uncharacterized protein B0H18DRAFT_964839 [Fomitopsis serialis]|uniref:uncharacterized protein n=1 Tax=Fomitopsis serialis TaxID=139415 RepID=UPI0020075702|nr:uncharacterized protein B0H18DRAFT_964839 [Neoantrodia serialis]KAH9905562.1 hypothetical protein B0H18DRAFT_964839 [Neoantrodia serialis]